MHFAAFRLSILSIFEHSVMSCVFLSAYRTPTALCLRRPWCRALWRRRGENWSRRRVRLRWTPSPWGWTNTGSTHCQTVRNRFMCTKSNVAQSHRCQCRVTICFICCAAIKASASFRLQSFRLLFSDCLGISEWDTSLFLALQHQMSQFLPAVQGFLSQ